MRQVAINELAEIIEQSLRNVKLQLTDDQFMHDIVQDFKARTLSVNLQSALPLMKELKDSLSKTSYYEIWPFLYLFIAYIYYNLSDLHAARIAAEDAVRKFNNDDWNLSLARWFLAIIYREDGYIKDAKEQLGYAQRTLLKIIAQSHDDDLGWRVKTDCHLLIDQIKLASERLPNGHTRLFDTARRDQKETIPSATDEGSAAATHDDDLGDNNTNRRARQDAGVPGPNPWDGGDGLEPPGEDGSSGPNGNHRDGEGGNGDDGLRRQNDPSPMNLHINIPIDIRSTDHTDQKSLQFTHIRQEQRSNQDQEAISATSVPMDVHLINVEPSRLQSSEETKQDDVNKEADMPLDVSELSYLMTPSLPIYGKASAGPNGQVVLDEPNYNAAVDESSVVRLNGEEYEVFSLRSDTLRIKISHKDFLTSIIPRKMREIGRKAYGWLKVTGNSMNQGQPIKNERKRIKIEDSDYVLFIENNNIDASVGKIVIVSESLPDAGPIRLLIKRLVRENNQLFLRSYSRDKNPDTGEEFGDLDFNDCYQLIGEVIGVAKPRSLEST